jgi:hypothetical protein
MGLREDGRLAVIPWFQLSFQETPMDVKASSDQPQMLRDHPYTALQLKVVSARSEAEKARRLEEMTFLSLVVQSLSPKVRLNEVNKAMRSVITHYKANNNLELPLE